MDRTKNIKEYLEDDFKKFIFEGIREFLMVGIQFFTGSDSVQVNFQKDPKLWLPVLHDEANCRAAQVLQSGMLVGIIFLDPKRKIWHLVINVR